MATTAKDILALLVTKLGTIVDDNTNSVFGSIVDHADGDFKEYPAVVVRPTGGRGVVIDTHRIHRVFSFEIALYQEQSRAGKDKQEAADIMIDRLDRILLAFDQDKDLNNQVEIVQVLKFTTDFTVRAGTFNFARIDVDIRVIVPNYA